jgi:hypothetical protein
MEGKRLSQSSRLSVTPGLVISGLMQAESKAETAEAKKPFFRVRQMEKLVV